MTIPPFKAGDKVTIDGDKEVRIMAIAEGWAMVRRKGAMPFLLMVRELKSGKSDSQIAMEQFDKLFNRK